MKVLELRGERALDALNGLYALLMGVKMLPQYELEPFEKFFERVANLEPDEQRKIIRLATAMVRPEPQALMGMLSFCTDANGVAYKKENIENLTIPQMMDIITEVSIEILGWNVGILSNAEKKN